MTDADVSIFDFLRAQLDEDERLLNAYEQSMSEAAARAGAYVLVLPPGWQAGEPFDIDRQRAEVDAKRRILRRGGPVCTCADQSQPMNPDTNWKTPLEHHLDCAAYETARLLALPYADRPGYRPEWGPQ